jgi:hypothetical protein
VTDKSVLVDTDRRALIELAPVLRRAAGLDPKALARLRFDAHTATVLVRLPFGILVSRTVEADHERPGRDITVRAGEALAWLDGDSAEKPQQRDTEWRGGLPPSSGWQRVETVPDDAVRPLVRSGATALKDAAAREGVPGAQPRAEVADALLDSTVLTVDDEQGATAEISLRALSALTRMGFLPRGGQAHIDVAGRWTRVVGGYGTVLLERPGLGLGLMSG